MVNKYVIKRKHESLPAAVKVLPQQNLKSTGLNRFIPVMDRSRAKLLTKNRLVYKKTGIDLGIGAAIYRKTYSIDI